MKLSRQKIQRMIDGQGTGGGGGGMSSAALESMLAMYATRQWVQSNFLTIEFFQRLFTVHGENDTTVDPNDTESTITAVESMFGFWTNFYISALGTGGGTTLGLRLSQLDDVSVSGVSNGQVLTWDNSLSKWVPSTPSSGVDMTTVWGALAGATSEQINATHLSAVLSSYAAQSWVTNNFLNVKDGGTVEAPVTFEDTVAIDGAVTMGSTLAVTGNITMGTKLVATQEWANNTFVQKNWFDQVFQIFNDQTKIAVNGELPVDQTKMNIKAMFGFWTNFYVTALGTGSASTLGLRLSQLDDVSVSGVSNGQVLTWDNSLSKWVPSTPSTGVDMATVWAALAAQDASKKIDISHFPTLFTALTNSGNDISMTIGGVTKKLQIAYATAAGDAATIGGTAKSGLLTDFSNITSDADAGKVQITVGGTTLKLAVDAATLGGTAKSGLFTDLSSTWATNLSATIGGTTLTVSSLNADYANQLRYSRSIWGQNFNGTADVSGDLYLNGSNLRLLDYGGSADCYICAYGTTSRKIGVAVEGSSLFEFNDEEFYSVHGIYAGTYVTALSDIRYKEVVNRFQLDVETIAKASLIQYRWKDKRDDVLHVGGIAQEWQKILPETVHEDKESRLSMDYGVIAFTSAVSLARRIKEQDNEIRDLREKNAQLERRLQRLESMFAVDVD